MSETTQVSYCPAMDASYKVGQIGADRSSIIFQFDTLFTEGNDGLNPLWNTASNRSPQLIRSVNPRRLHGVFADSLPDAWGRAVLRRHLASRGIDFEALSPVVQLQVVGSRAPGALQYEPAKIERQRFPVDLDRMVDDATAVLEAGDVRNIEQLAYLAGSSGGARPKLLVDYERDDCIRAFDELHSDGARAWIVKLPSRYDFPDIGPLEAAYADMARRAGLSVMPTMCIASRSTPFGYFATRRFDRDSGTRRHFTSAAGLLDVEWSEPSVAYRDLFKLVRFVTKAQADVEALLKRMIFNVATHNRDDHTKQHAFFNDFAGNWSLTAVVRSHLRTWSGRRTLHGNKRSRKRRHTSRHPGRSCGSANIKA